MQFVQYTPMLGKRGSWDKLVNLLAEDCPSPVAITIIPFNVFRWCFKFDLDSQHTIPTSGDDDRVRVCVCVCGHFAIYIEQTWNV